MKSKIEIIIQDFAIEVNLDIVGFWDIVQVGQKHFDLRGNEIRQYIKNCIIAIYDAGGVVVDSSEDEAWHYQSIERYGTEKHQIADAILDEWIKNGQPMIESWTGIAFVNRDYLHSLDNFSSKRNLLWYLKRLKTHPHQSKHIKWALRCKLFYIRIKLEYFAVNWVYVIKDKIIK